MKRKQDVQRVQKQTNDSKENEKGSTRELCFVTLGFPVPDTDHQKHASSLVEALDMARLYIAAWMQAVCERSKEQL
jgi:hypothetical protein